MTKNQKPASNGPATGQGNGQGKNGRTFRRFITLKNGRVLDAHDYGHKAWPIGKR